MSERERAVPCRACRRPTWNLRFCDKCAKVREDGASGVKVGITGTQRGATSDQLAKLTEVLHEIGATEIHHGDCIGVDSEVHDLAREMGLKVVLHPPTIGLKRAFCPADEYREPKPYLERNHDIVDETVVLIAIPGEVKEQLRSGTWSTVRYAKRVGRPVLVITPAGVSV